MNKRLEYMPTVEVHARLFEEDVIELKRRAEALGSSSMWQALLRQMLHNALKEKKEVIR